MPAISTLKRSGLGIGPSEAAFRQLTRKRLLVGIPDTAAERPPEPGQKGTPPSNAVVGYAMEYGLPDKNIPARPFLIPGIKAALPAIVTGMLKSTTAALSAKPGDINKGLDEAGLAAVASVQGKMIDGPFAPLAQATIEARARRRYEDTGKLVGTKSSREARQFLKLQQQGTPDEVLHDAGLATPLLDTRSLFRSITYVIKDK